MKTLGNMRTALVCLFTLYPVTALAGEPPSMTSAALQTLWALLIVIGLIFAFYALARKRFFLSKIGGTAIRVIEMRPLQPKATLALVEVRGREYLLAINAGNITLLADLNPSNQPSNDSDFSSILAESK
ncbi:MAG: flagellar biosynthetic protein FliO [Desulfobulbus sp.]|nr:flagellar biosynthetic protein FliO [Desulfobulbus sp.]